jgi:hypothetical protein
MAKEEKPVRGAGRVAFWAREKEVKEMIDAKHTLRNIYRRYGEEMNISYEQFARYVNKFIRSKPTNENHGEKTDAAIQPSGTKRRERPTGFTLNTDTSDKRKKTIV